MSLQKDIHQLRNFRNENHKAIVNLIFTTNWLSEKIKNFLDKEDITLQQYNILRILRGSFPQPLSTLQIRERMLDKMSDTSRIVDRLVIKGFAKKTTCKADKRLVDVLITDKGRKLLGKLDAKSDNMDSIIARLSEKETKTLNKLLDKARGSIR
ncbi:MAG TPA: MarR family transcriptional regulator [Chitinophagaceae bacterium]|nr:MarR family transcriptional regulator [Chitinophagaceae bacterium]